jgi:hypothetical protein
VLAAVLRETEAGLVIGSPTAGQAHPFRSFPLSNGEILKIAAGTVELAGGDSLSPDGLSPDVRVQISEAEERSFLDDPYRMVARSANSGRPHGTLSSSLSSTNRFGRRRINEADLVRMQREGISIERDPEAIIRDMSKPVIQDPALGRALDFLKGMAVVKSRR